MGKEAKKRKATDYTDYTEKKSPIQTPKPPEGGLKAGRHGIEVPLRGMGLFWEKK